MHSEPNRLQTYRNINTYKIGVLNRLVRDSKFCVEILTLTLCMSMSCCWYAFWAFCLLLRIVRGRWEIEVGFLYLESKLESIFFRRLSTSWQAPSYCPLDFFNMTWTLVSTQQIGLKSLPYQRLHPSLSPVSWHIRHDVSGSPHIVWQYSWEGRLSEVVVQKSSDHVRRRAFLKLRVGLSTWSGKRCDGILEWAHNSFAVVRYHAFQENRV